MLCSKSELVTESDVEQKLIMPLLTLSAPRGLGYGTEEILTKHSIRRFTIDKGQSQKLYFPDFLVLLCGMPCLAVEAKKPGEDVIEGLREARLYAAELNAIYPSGINPCLRVICCNGAKLVSAPQTALPPISRYNLRSSPKLTRALRNLFTRPEGQRLMPNSRAFYPPLIGRSYFAHSI